MDPGSGGGRLPAGSTDDAGGDSTLHIVERARRGDESAARVLIERALPAVRRWTHGRLPRKTRASADTEDVVQDAVLGTLKRLRTFNHRSLGALQAYLREAVVNRIRDLVRRSKTRGVTVAVPDELPAMEPTALEAAILKEEIATFLGALQRLRPTDRQLIVWRIELGYTLDEIARRTGKSKPAAAMTVSRAMARLKAHIEAERRKLVE